MKYKITDIRQRSKEVKGERVLYMRVFYETETKFAGVIDVPKRRFKEEKVREEIEKEIVEISKLTIEKVVKR